MITAVLLVGLFVVLLRIDLGIHNSAKELARIASALENSGSPGVSGGNRSLADRAAARNALNAKKAAAKAIKPAEVCPAPSGLIDGKKGNDAYDGKSNGLVDAFNDDIGTDKRSAR